MANMSAGTLGMDPAAVTESANRISYQAAQIEAALADLISVVGSIDSVWQGTDMGNFQDEFNDTHAPNLRVVISALQEFSDLARRQVEEQTSASSS